MRGYETIQHFEESNERIMQLPWDKKKVRIVYELKNSGMSSFEIEGELDGVVTKAEVRSILIRLNIYTKNGDINGLNYRR